MTDQPTRLRQLAASAERDGTLPTTEFIRALRVTAHDETPCALCGEAVAREPAQLVASHVRTALLHLQCFDAWADLLSRNKEGLSTQRDPRQHIASIEATAADTSDTNVGDEQAYEAPHAPARRRHWAARHDEHDTREPLREAHVTWSFQEESLHEGWTRRNDPWRLTGD